MHNQNPPADLVNSPTTLPRPAFPILQLRKFRFIFRGNDNAFGALFRQFKQLSTTKSP
ncbi:hypothetical protein CLOSTMETH_01383 [[Clostridium] methylpentosum DSM 5476]|uniref:Uncharacterized protein n=1 Tax=[Clostridium] methylpentosum DSM 5476 TaxID=537013 RepID=C0EC14_9FIRM|nr:hypothetical protein CLOSTMETH_01383 [[Clostridium] methylpentosum DSM 5476]